MSYGSISFSFRDKDDQNNSHIGKKKKIVTWAFKSVNGKRSYNKRKKNKCNTGSDGGLKNDIIATSNKS